MEREELRNNILVLEDCAEELEQKNQELQERLHEAEQKIKQQEQLIKSLEFVNMLLTTKKGREQYGL